MTQNKTMDLSNRVALVTGAGQGVGYAIATELAQLGAGVVVNDYFTERAEQAAANIQAAGGQAVGIGGDVSSRDSVQNMLSEAESQLGPIDILVNNAGNAGPGGFPEQLPRFWQTDPEDWDKWFSVNLYGVMNCCHAALPGMTERGYGRVVTIISDAGRLGEAHLAAYSAAKAGAAGFMRALAKEAGRFNVTANCVALGGINSPQLADQASGFDPEIAKKMLRGYSIRRLGEPEDVSTLVAFLCSDAACWITGQTYPVNGGISSAV